MERLHYWVAINRTQSLLKRKDIAYFRIHLFFMSACDVLIKSRKHDEQEDRNKYSHNLIIQELERLLVNLVSNEFILTWVET